MNALEFKKKVLAELEKKTRMVLATCANNRVTARNVSTIFMNQKIYFQTDKEFLKYFQITENPYVALCELDMQVEGIAQVLGHPLEEHNREFLTTFVKKHPDSFAKYTYLPNEVVIEVTPRLVEMWVYENDRPSIYTFNFENDAFAKRDYPMNHNMKLNESPFTKMKEGTKTIEYRLNDEKRQLVRIGDTILFSRLPDLTEKLLTEVIDIQRFNTFYDAFKELPDQSNSDIDTDIEKSVNSMHELYSPEEEEKQGTIAIKIKVLKRYTN